MPEHHLDPGPVPPALPLVRRAPSLEPPTDDRRATLRLLPTGSTPRPREPRPGAVVATTPVDPAARVGVVRVLTLALEVQDGRRSPQQLRTLLPAPLVEGVTTRARTAVGHRRQPARLRLVHVQLVTRGVVEAFALVDRGARAHAMAARMELVGHRWRCTALWLG